MNNKIEIFKLALQAGSVKLTEEQSKFAIDCFIKAEKLSGGGDQRQFSQKHKVVHPSYQKSKGVRSGPFDFWTGERLFIKEKMAELKSNGCDYQKNKASAQEVWNQLLDEEKQVWKNKAAQMVQK